MTKSISLRSTALLLTLPLALLSGCASPLKTAASNKDDGASMWWPWKSDSSKPYPNPVRMAVTWTPDVLVQAGRTPTRGFGGRVYFYNELSQAVPVEGDMMVHAFDEAVTQDGDPNGVKRYRFTSDQFTKHFSESDLGASYSIWIPWDAAGGPQAKLSLVPSFKSYSGKVVQGEAAKLVLPGKKVEAVASKRSMPSIRQVGHFVGTPDNNNPTLSGSSNMQTTTIPLPSSFQQRLARMNEQTKPSTRIFSRTRSNAIPQQSSGGPTPLPTP